MAAQPKSHSLYTSYLNKAIPPKPRYFKALCPCELPQYRADITAPRSFAELSAQSASSSAFTSLAADKEYRPPCTPAKCKSVSNRRRSHTCQRCHDASHSSGSAARDLAGPPSCET